MCLIFLLLFSSYSCVIVEVIKETPIMPGDKETPDESPQLSYENRTLQEYKHLKLLI